MFQVAPSDPSLSTFHFIWLISPQNPNIGSFSWEDKDGPVTRPLSSPQTSPPPTPSHALKGIWGLTLINSRWTKCSRTGPGQEVSPARWRLTLRHLGASGGTWWPSSSWRLSLFTSRRGLPLGPLLLPASHCSHSASASLTGPHVTKAQL